VTDGGGELRVHSRPELRRPVLVASFRGWNDGGQGASSAGSFLAKTWRTETFAEIDSEGFFDFSQTRPQISLVEGSLRRIEWPANSFQLARLDGTYNKRAYVRETASKPPSGYLSNLLFDTVLYDPAPIEFLLATFGPERVVFGTDHPFDIADLTGLEVAKGLGDEAAELVLGGNAARAYGL